MKRVAGAVLLVAAALVALLFVRQPERSRRAAEPDIAEERGELQAALTGIGARIPAAQPGPARAKIYDELDSLLAGASDDAVETLLIELLLTEKDPPMVAAMIRRLSAIQPPSLRSIPTIVDVLGRDDCGEGELRADVREASEALVKFSFRAVPALEAATRHKGSFSGCAEMILRRINTPEAAAALARWKLVPGRQVRMSGVQVKEGEVWLGHHRPVRITSTGGKVDAAVPAFSTTGNYLAAARKTGEKRLPGGDSIFTWSILIIDARRRKVVDEIKVGDRALAAGQWVKDQDVYQYFVEKTPRGDDFELWRYDAATRVSARAARR